MGSLKKQKYQDINKKIMKLVFIAQPLLAFLASANVFLHSPRGSNNRLNENSAQNSEPKRLFYSNNNRRGGYNVGDKTDQPFQDESGQYAMRYFGSGKNGGDSFMTVEWTNLVGCGVDEDGDKINNCDVVLQTYCQDNEIDKTTHLPNSDSWTLRNGKKREQMKYKRNLFAGNLDNPEGKCFRDSHQRDLEHMVNNRLPNIPDGQVSSIEWCRNTCNNLGYLYAGVQYERECWCGNDYGKYGEASINECNRNCRDQSNGQNKCGGSWRQNIYLSFDPVADEDESLQSKNDRKSASVDKEIGLHESWEFFDRCNNENMEKNKIGARYGMECEKERENFPYKGANGQGKISPWVDVAYLTDDLNKCSEVENNNQAGYFECVEFYEENGVKTDKRKHWSKFQNQADCEANQGQWLEFFKAAYVLNRDQQECENYKVEALKNGKTVVWGREMNWKDLSEDKLTEEKCLVLPEKVTCRQVPSTRTGYLGDADNSRETPRFQWKLPSFENDKRCIFRIRYMIKSSDEVINFDNNVVMVNGDPLSLAVFPKSTVFEDRSHVFEIVQRNGEISEDLTVHNLVVRGKRGNIVQTYPAVEYDFVPSRLNINKGEAVHVQWTGSNTHRNGNPAGDGQAGDAGEGRSGTDRHNFIQLVDRKANLVAPFHNHTLVQGSQWVWSSHEMGRTENKNFNLALSLATSGYYQCKHDDECTRKFDNTLNDQLDNAPASFGGEIFIPSQGGFHYKCMRNDNFSNRSQKGTITVL